MNFYSETLTFEPANHPRNTDSTSNDTHLLGIRVRLGNRPIVTRLNDYITRWHKALPPQLEAIDLYTVVHAIGALRVEGRASVKQLQYHAAFSAPAELGNIAI